MHDYIVEAKSRSDLRAYALQIRTNLGMQERLFFPVAQFLELMPELFPPFHYEIVEDDIFNQNVHADTDVLKHCIRIKNCVYEGACEGNGRDRMTIAHEMGHYFTLCISGFKLQRNFGNKKPKAYLDPEWQAKCFAGELLVPAHLVHGMDALAVAKKSQYRDVLSPDFSMYTNMPLASQIWNVFRRRWCSAYWQSNGITVIPAVSWSDERSFDFCFDGIEKGSVVAVSTIGSRKHKDAYLKGFTEMCHRLKPEKVLCYYKPFEEMLNMAEIITLAYEGLAVREDKHHLEHKAVS